ncbi:MAG: hypothetical protein ABSB74_02175 [Tepidisphaeraceae bacterium]
MRAAIGGISLNLDRADEREFNPWIISLIVAVATDTPKSIARIR